MDRLSDDLFRYILTWIAEGNYLWIALISRRFRAHMKSAQKITYVTAPLLRDCLEMGYKRTPKTAGILARAGDIQQLQWLWQMYPHSINADTLEQAIQYDQLDVLKWLRAEGPDIFGLYLATYYSAKKGRLRILQWMVSEKLALHSYTLALAAARGDLDMIKWFLEFKQTCTIAQEREISHKEREMTMTEAARNGQIEVLAFLHERRFRLTDQCYLAAIRGGQMEVLEWLHARRCPWSHQATRIAAKDGARPILEWLLLRGCPYRPLELWTVSRGETRQWLRTNGFAQPQFV